MSALRVAAILAAAIRHRLDEVLVPRARELHIAWLLPSFWRGPCEARVGERLAAAFDELGPVFVKLGQLLSVRPDLIPEQVAADLATLRDRVSPVGPAQIGEVLAAAYGRPAAEVFAELEPIPVASASIAQVHRARLPSGEQVAVKVVRPGIGHVIERDIALLRRLAAMGERWAGTARRLRASELVELYHEIITHELDMVREGANAAQLRTNFRESDLLDVPRVHWEYTRRDVLVSDFVEGIPLDQMEGLKAANIDLTALAERGVEIFFTQVFVHNFFHADMHPGNIFALAGEAPDVPRYLAVDFGIMGSLGRSDQRYLAENFLAFFNRDYRRVAELHVTSGWVPEGTRVEAFEAAIRAVCEPVFERPLGEIAFGELLVRLFQTAREFDMQIRPELVLLQKTLLHIEGLGRTLYPELDLWRTAKPFFERWMWERSSPESVARALGETLPRWSALFAEHGPALPDRIARALAPKPVPSPPPSRSWGIGAAVVGLSGVALLLLAQAQGFVAGAGLVLVGVSAGLFVGAKRH